MEKQAEIFFKLDSFIKRYYTNTLIKGTIFFLGIGLLYFLFTIFIEYFLWLKPVARTILFVVFVVFELFLLFRYILFPVFKLFKLQKGIGFPEASKIIGTHFSEVGDKLTNFLQLSQNHEKSELLLASINQKANSLQPIPFGNAINFNQNKRFLPLLILPVLIFLYLFISGNSNILTQSFNRVVNFKSQFAPPVPFEFEVLNKNLQTEQGKDFVLQVKTIGNVVPETASIIIGNEQYFMEALKSGVFQYKFTKPTTNVVFAIESNVVKTTDFILAVVAVPTITNLQLTAIFPSYLHKNAEVIKGSGNAIVPEGTKFVWQINTLATDNVSFINQDKKASFSQNNNIFSFSKVINENTDYQIVTSNSKVTDFEKLNYQIAVTKDQFPSIDANIAPDSLKAAKNYVIGQVSDDYGFSKLQIVYYPKSNPNKSKRFNLSVKPAVFDQFVFSFPSNLPVEAGVAYDFYFEIFDNDAIHNFKSSRSAVFSDKVLSETEIENQLLQQQNEAISSLSKSLKNQDKQLSELDKIQKATKEKDNLEFKDIQKVNDFIKRQQKQDDLMKEFSQKMKENLQQNKTNQNDDVKKELEKRFDNQLKELEKNQKLLEELKQLNEKLKQEDLGEKLDKFKQQSQNQIKNLEQLVELTKRYYVEKKAEQLVDKLKKLADKQDELSEKQAENNKENQKEINEEFDKIQEELKDLEKENKELKAPLDIPNDAEKEKSIDEDLKKATDELHKDSKDAKEKAKPKQKSAAKKMKEMSQKMEQSMDMDAMDQAEEDAAMLRQILDNLLSFSFSEESTMSQFKNIKRNAPSYNKNLKNQQDLRLQFQHVDDSLFALGMRNPKITELINTEVGNVHYNINKAVETLVEGNISKGVYHQQYTVSSSNKLADMLSESLNNMQMEMKGKGSKGKGKPKPGKGSGMQLPDIIQKQQGLAEKMKKAMEKGNKPGDKSGDKPGQKPGEGKEGKDGKGQKPDGKEKGGTEGEGGDDGEGNAGELLKIYQEQKQLRDALQKELNEKGLGGSGQSALDKMKDVEKQLLNKGFKNDILEKVLNIKQELLKLDKAVQEQGEEERRKADVAKKQFQNTANQLPAAIKNYLNSIEILNRQNLPLQKNYSNKVQQYFKTK
jgi:hypothetical protein